ncbi:hypothetical protein ACLODM_06885 [Limosilactobacillus mucosae]|uniref:hypothetical protein n=1 Tax=Limosilactobacillus mucosae TaxID=97478 RepID=UPI0022E8FE01|nr:hypothetical protein [Limosilactobacillus mucosae]
MELNISCFSKSLGPMRRSANRNFGEKWSADFWWGIAEPPCGKVLNGKHYS